MTKLLPEIEKEDSGEFDVSIEEVAVSDEWDNKPDFVRVKYTEKKGASLVGYTTVFILAD